MTDRPVLTKDQLWPPCGRCGSDGFPADFGAGQPGGEYLCYDCNPGWLREVLPERRWAEADRRHVEQKDEVLAMREDPTCFSYRGLGRVA